MIVLSMKSNLGLTLLELLITVAILGILATIVYPQYQQYITRTYRIHAAQALLIIDKGMQDYYMQHQSYLGVTLASITANSSISEPHYHYQIKALMPQSYQLIAIPFGIQARHDQRCGNLIINQWGEKSISGSVLSMTCWQ